MHYNSEIYSGYLGDDQMARFISDEAFIDKMISFEIALARAQALDGIIPVSAADAIENGLKNLRISPLGLSESVLHHGIPVIGLLDIAKEKLADEVKPFLHYNATSQDAMDTALILMIKEAVQLIGERIKNLIENYLQLISQYGDTPCMAHTRGQQAVPINFGIKVKAWMHPLERQIQRLTEMEKRLFVVQLGGAAGDLSFYPDKARKLISNLANELKLAPSSSWHTQRDNLSEFTGWLAILTGILGKMGADILFMAQSEINEITENVDGGKSSAMPHKNNPVLSEALVALARINGMIQSQQLLSLVHLNERDASAWILEWNAIPQMILNAGTALKHAISISRNMKVNVDMMNDRVKLFLASNKNPK